MKTGSTLPLFPSQTVQISSDVLKASLDSVMILAEEFGFWQYPYASAATAIEEMTLNDIFYWVYKSQNPIIFYDQFKTSPFNMLPLTSYLPIGFQEDKIVTSGFAGDILQVQQKGFNHNSKDLYGNIHNLLFGKDISFANLESPVTEQELQQEIISDTCPPIECCSEEQFDSLKGYNGQNFTLMNTTNNHSLDMGIEGLCKTYETLRKNNIIVLGTTCDEQDYGKAQIIEKNGIKIGFISTTFGLNGRNLDQETQNKIHVSPICSTQNAPDLSLIKAQIADCKSQNCDFIVASLHWGWEFEFFPRNSQIETAHQIVEAGADMIVGHHPHVVQPVEYYRTKRDANRVAVIAYSLGSLTWEFVAPHIVLSMILNIDISKGTYDNHTHTYIKNVTITPVFRSCLEKDGTLSITIEKLSEHISGTSKHDKEYIKHIQKYAELIGIQS